MITAAASRLDLTPARKVKLGDQLYGQILEQIVGGALKEGDRLPSENEICRMFAVSRAVVREALSRLQADGLVSAQHGVGSFVARRPPKSLIELAAPSDVPGILACFELRIAVESEAAALAAKRRSDDHIRRLREALDQMQQCLARKEPAIKADLGFHRLIAAASGNEYFSTVLTSLHFGIDRWVSIASSMTAKIDSADRPKRVFDEHLRIVDAIAEGDVEQARLAMRYHLDQAKRRLTDSHRDI